MKKTTNEVIEWKYSPSRFKRQIPGPWLHRTIKSLPW